MDPIRVGGGGVPPTPKKERVWVLATDWSREFIKWVVNAGGCVYTMPYKDPVKQRESVKQWKIKNREEKKEQKKNGGTKNERK